MQYFDKYKKNLKIEGNFIMSYNTPVAMIFWGKEIVVDKFYSSTTSKHINYAGEKLGLNVVKIY